LKNVIWNENWTSNNGSKIFIKGKCDLASYSFEIDMQVSSENDNQVEFEYTLYCNNMIIYNNSVDIFLMEDIIVEIQEECDIDLTSHHIDLFEYLDLIKGE
jgi:hypothetical protein